MNWFTIFKLSVLDKIIVILFWKTSLEYLGGVFFVKIFSVNSEVSFLLIFLVNISFWWVSSFIFGFSDTILFTGAHDTNNINNDKNTVISLREIAEENIKVPDLAQSAIYKLRKHVEQIDDGSEEDEEVGDDFESLYKGEISKSGTPILPSKRARKTPDKIQVSKEDLAELSQTAQPDVEVTESDDPQSEQAEVSLEEVSDNENQETEVSSEDSETSNS